MKKALVILLTLALVSTLAFAGTQPAKASGPVTVKVLAYGDNANPEGQNWVRIVDAFMAANPNIKIEYEMLYDEAYHQKVTARLASGDVPHMAYMGADVRWGQAWKEAKQQFDHRPYLDKNYYDMGIIGSMGDNGEVWEVPLGSANLCTTLYFNTELAASLGLSEPKTYEDMVAMVGPAKAAGLEVVAIDGADGWAWGSCLMSSFIARVSGDGGWMKKAVAGKAKFTDKVFVDSLNLLTQMVADGVLSPKMINVDWGGNLAYFNNKKALFMVQGQWITGSIVPEVADVTKVMAWPKMPGEKGAAGSVAAAINPGYGITQAAAKDPAVRDAALLFIKFYNSTEEVIQRLKDGGIVAPVLKNYTIPEDLAKINVSKIELAKKVGIGTDVIDAYIGGAANEALNAGMQQIVAGTKTGEQIAAEVQALFDKGEYKNK